MNRFAVDERPHRSPKPRRGVDDRRRGDDCAARRWRREAGRSSEGGRHRSARPDERGPAGAARRSSICAAFPGLDDIAEDGDGGLRIGAMATLDGLADAPVRAAALSGAGRCAAPGRPARRSAMSRRSAAICCNGRAAGISAPTRIAACARAAGRCFAIPGENQYHAIFANEVCAIVHPSTAATALVGARCAHRTRQRPGRGAPSRCSTISSSLRKSTCSARTISSLARRPRPCCCRLSPPAPPPHTCAKPTSCRSTGRSPTSRWRWSATSRGAAAAPRSFWALRRRFRTGRAPPRISWWAKRSTRPLARAAGEAALEGATPLAKNRHKLPIFAALVRRALLRAAGQG